MPKQIYVNSEQRLRRTDDIQRELILNRIHHKKFNPFLTSKKGELYFKGIWTDPKADAKATTTVAKFIDKGSLNQTESQLAVLNTSGPLEISENEQSVDAAQQPADIMQILVANHRRRE